MFKINLVKSFRIFIDKLSGKKTIAILLGFFALSWFLIRVIPKPSRASYPCQRAAFPLASAFVIWLTGLITSALFFIKFKKSLRENKLAYAAMFIVLFGVSLLIYISIYPSGDLFAGSSTGYRKAPWDENRRTESLQNKTVATFDEVAVVRSSKANVSDIDYEEIEDLVREAVDMAGGLGEIINNGDYVVLKPNLVSVPPDTSSLYKEVSGIATDWRVTKAVAKIVRELDPDGKIYIIECSSASSTGDVLDFYKYTHENIPEVDGIVALEDSCGAFEDYGDINLEQVFLEDSVRLYPDNMKPNNSPEFYINRIYLNADVVISIPVLKNHKEAIITGGVKNVAIGMAPPNIYGMEENFFGKWTKIDHSQANLHKWIHDYYLCRPVDFVVVDGLQGFDHGPTGVEGLTMEEMQHNMRLIVAGRKALSVDAVCGHIMSLDPAFANYMVYLDKEMYGAGTVDSRFIRLKGEKIAGVREVFSHTSQVATNAIYTDYDPPSITVTSTAMEGNTLTLAIQGVEELVKIELEVNGILLDQVCIGDFASASFEIGDELLPVDSLRLFAFDRFFNVNTLVIDFLAIKENDMEFVRLDQNFPNPFTGATEISFTLSLPGRTKLIVTDISGKLVEILVDEKIAAGQHQVRWNGNAPNGIYFCTLEVEGRKLIRRMIKNDN